VTSLENMCRTCAKVMIHKEALYQVYVLYRVMVGISHTSTSGNTEGQDISSLVFNALSYVA